MITHVIYHIPGRKVGCTRNLDYRMYVYKWLEGTIPNHEILEELHDKTDKEAGDIEWQWADKLGYLRGPHYAQTISISMNMSFGQRSDRGRKGGKQRIQNQTPEKRSEIGRMGGFAVRNRKIPRLTFEQSSRRSKRTTSKMVAEKHHTLQQSQCPNCGQSGGFLVLHRWHFDNCRRRKIGFVRGN